MKKMTCRDMGGSCDAEMMANTKEEMKENGMAHAREAHPNLAAKMGNMTEEEKSTWNADFEQKWETAPKM